jgi:hypothetical protein
MDIARTLPVAWVVRPGFWTQLVNAIAAARCRFLHRSISRPVKGKYVCWTCLREFPTEW